MPSNRFPRLLAGDILPWAFGFLNQYQSYYCLVAVVRVSVNRLLQNSAPALRFLLIVLGFGTWYRDIRRLVR